MRRTERPIASPAARENVREYLSQALRARRTEIEENVLTRVVAISGSEETVGSEYASALRAAVAAAIDHGVKVIESDPTAPPQPPLELLVQARIASRNAIRLETVLRRYFVGYTLLCDFLLDEASAIQLGGGQLQMLLRVLGSAFDQLVGAVSEEHRHETQACKSFAARSHYQLVTRLLAGERLDARHLNYDLDAHHLGVIAVGEEAPDALRSLATSLDRRLLLVQHNSTTTWGWLGGARPTDIGEFDGPLRAWPAQVTLAIGCPGTHPAGWRLTHYQAGAALPIALRGPRNLVRYGDVALLAALLDNGTLATSLRQAYLEPLSHRGRDEALLETLRAYLDSECNTSSAAALLGVKRHTVTNRLRMVEKRLGKSLMKSLPEIGMALQLEFLDEIQAKYDTGPAHAS